MINHGGYSVTKLKYLLNIILLLSFVGCTKTCATKKREAMSPEQVVQSYLDISFSMNDISDRAKLINLTIGPLREQLERLFLMNRSMRHSSRKDTL